VRGKFLVHVTFSQRLPGTPIAIRRFEKSGLAGLCISLLLLGSCAVLRYHDLAPNLPDDQVAVLDWRNESIQLWHIESAPMVCIDGSTYRWRAYRTRVPPGPHIVELRRWSRGFSAQSPSDDSSLLVVYELNLEAGRTYRVRCSDSPISCWIEDTVSGERVGDILQETLLRGEEGEGLIGGSPWICVYDQTTPRD